jgi:hypothetical protein
MKLVSTGSFDRLQQALAAEIIRTVKLELEKVGAPPDLVEQLSGSIAFSVASLIDDVAGFEHEGKAVNPMLTFLVSDEELEFAGGNSWMHEYIYRLVPGIFSNEEKPVGDATDA